MVLIAERAIIDIICVMIVFNKVKYHICDNNEFASYLLRRTINAYARAYCSVNFLIFFCFLLIFQCILLDILQLLGQIYHRIYTLTNTLIPKIPHMCIVVWLP